jgi:hypothetical protein
MGCRGPRRNYTPLHLSPGPLPDLRGPPHRGTVRSIGGRVLLSGRSSGRICPAVHRPSAQRPAGRNAPSGRHAAPSHCARPAGAICVADGGRRAKLTPPRKIDDRRNETRTAISLRHGRGHRAFHSPENAQHPHACLLPPYRRRAAWAPYSREPDENGCLRCHGTLPGRETTGPRR